MFLNATHNKLYPLFTIFRICNHVTSKLLQFKKFFFFKYTWVGFISGKPLWPWISIRSIRTSGRGAFYRKVSRTKACYATKVRYVAAVPSLTQLFFNARTPCFCTTITLLWVTNINSTKPISLDSLTIVNLMIANIIFLPIYNEILVF